MIFVKVENRVRIFSSSPNKTVGLSFFFIETAFNAIAPQFGYAHVVVGLERVEKVQDDQACQAIRPIHCVSLSDE